MQYPRISTASHRQVPGSVKVRTTLYQFIQSLGEDYDDQAVGEVVTRMMESGQIRLTGNQQRLKKLLEE